MQSWSLNDGAIPPLKPEDAIGSVSRVVRLSSNAVHGLDSNAVVSITEAVQDNNTVLESDSTAVVG